MTLSYINIRNSTAPHLLIFYSADNAAVLHDRRSDSGPRGPKQAGDRRVAGILLLAGLVLLARGVSRARRALSVR